MTSRFAPSFPVLNGPHGGDRINAPPGTLAGSGVAMAWAGPKGMQYAVYVLVEIPDAIEAPPPSELPAEIRPKKLGLAFVRTWPTPGEAQNHVREISLVANVAREVAKSN